MNKIIQNTVTVDLYASYDLYNILKYNIIFYNL